MKSACCLISWLMFLASLGCQTHNYTQRGAAVGGLSGAGLGAVLGDIAGDRPIAGAAVGSAVGALAGASMGAALDEVDARQDQRIQQAVYGQQSRGLSLNEVVAMSTSGLSDEIISRHIRDRGFSRPLDTPDLIALREQGVSDRVIAAMQQASTPAATHVLQSPPPPMPVFVERPYRAVPYPLHPHWRYRGHACPPGPRVHWGFSFGH